MTIAPITDGEGVTSATGKINAVIAVVNDIPLTVTVPLNTAAIRALHNSPVEVVATPGPGQFARLTNITILYTFNSQPFYAGLIKLKYGSGKIITGSYALFDNTESYVFYEVSSLRADAAEIDNQNIVITSEQEAGDYGAIATSSLGSSGGSGYAPGDTFDINAVVDAAQPCVVDTVDGGGAVLTYHRAGAVGVFPIAADYGTTATSGGGSGLLIDVDTVTPSGNGSATVTVAYEVLDAPA